jgi:hypothetical protein
MGYPIKFSVQLVACLASAPLRNMSWFYERTFSDQGFILPQPRSSNYPSMPPSP